LGLALYYGDSWHEASRELLTYRRLTGRKDQNHVIADCYRAVGRYDKAIEICREVSPKDVEPEVWAEVVIVAASSFADKGDVNRALAETARADLEPKRVEEHTLRVWYVRADLLERAGERAQAKKMWERIYAEDPDFYDVASKIGRG
ncbi:MAG: tetratricopeptide repeat protein, partial [Acidimicrobiia bacterium]